MSAPDATLRGHLRWRNFTVASEQTTGFYHRISVFDNETEALVTDILLTTENLEALRPYLAVGDDDLVIGEHEIGPKLSLFVGAFASD